jgi:hypothetical protein
MAARDRVRFGRPAARAAPIRDSTDGDDHRDRLPAAFDAKIGVLREAAGDRFGDLEISALATFFVTDKRRADTEDLIARRGWCGIEAERRRQDLPALGVTADREGLNRKRRRRTPRYDPAWRRG